MSGTHVVNQFLGPNQIDYASSLFNQTAVDAMSVEEAGQRANVLFSLIKNANILRPYQSHPGSEFPTDVQNLIDALQRLRTRAGGGSVPAARA